MNVTTVGIDLAKSVFQVHGADARGKPLLRRQLRRDQVTEFFANLPPCLVGMEACSGAHHWARKLESLGHTVRLMAPQFVRPYVKSGKKNDAADAEAICEAVIRPTMRFVPVKNVEQQAVLALHRVRQGLVKARTAQANQIRGLMAEYGIVVPQGLRFIASRLPQLLDDAANEMPGLFRQLVEELLEEMRRLGERIDEIEAQIRLWHRDCEASRRLQTIPGIGPITASALVATIGDARSFDSGRQLAAWLGLVPRQHSSGGKPVLLGITKRGDSYLRTLLVLGARAVMRHVGKRPRLDGWLLKIESHRHTNVAAVALANKTARTVWALLTRGGEYRADYVSTAACTASSRVSARTTFILAGALTHRICYR